MIPLKMFSSDDKYIPTLRFRQLESRIYAGSGLGGTYYRTFMKLQQAFVLEGSLYLDTPDLQWRDVETVSEE